MSGFTQFVGGVAGQVASRLIMNKVATAGLGQRQPGYKLPIQVPEGAQVDRQPGEADKSRFKIPNWMFFTGYGALLWYAAKATAPMETPDLGAVQREMFDPEQMEIDYYAEPEPVPDQPELAQLYEYLDNLKPGKAANVLDACNWILGAENCTSEQIDSIIDLVKQEGYFYLDDLRKAYKGDEAKIPAHRKTRPEPEAELLFPSLKREITSLDVEDVATSDEPVEACLERAGWKLRRVDDLRQSIFEKQQADIFTTPKPLTRSEDELLEAIESCMQRLESQYGSLEAAGVGCSVCDGDV